MPVERCDCGACRTARSARDASDIHFLGEQEIPIGNISSTGDAPPFTIHDVNPLTLTNQSRQPGDPGYARPVDIFGLSPSAREARELAQQTPQIKYLDCKVGIINKFPRPIGTELEMSSCGVLRTNAPG